VQHGERRGSFGEAWRGMAAFLIQLARRRVLTVAGWAMVSVLFVSTWACATAETPPSDVTSLASGSGGVGGGTLATATPVSTPTPTPTPAPTPKPTAPPAPTKAPVKQAQAPPPATNTCGAPANPWRYNFCGGNVISNPPSSFCGYFGCIASFWTTTNGYVEQCVDGLFSHSGGRSGSCSHHGGNRRPLYGP